MWKRFIVRYGKTFHKTTFSENYFQKIVDNTKLLQ